MLKHLIGDHPISIKEVIHELMEHNHPGSRLINNQQLLAEQRRQELVQHYKFAHGIMENPQNYFYFRNFDFLSN